MENHTVNLISQLDEKYKPNKPDESILAYAILGATRIDDEIIKTLKEFTDENETN